MRIILLIGVVIAIGILIFLSPVFNDVLSGLTPSLVTNVTSNMLATYTANGTVIYGQGALMNSIGTNLGLICIFLIPLIYLIMSLIKGVKGQEEVE